MWKYNYTNSTELHHSGIKGMKWGIRRYQNPDGTLTPAGKARYYDSGKKKDPRDMTIEDLKDSTKRLKAENEYRDNINKANKYDNRKINKLIQIGAATAGSFIVVGGGQLAKEYVDNKNKDPKYKLGKNAIKSALISGGAAGGMAALLTSISSNNIELQRNSPIPIRKYDYK